jgi:hypothetical protein
MVIFLLAAGILGANLLVGRRPVRINGAGVLQVSGECVTLARSLPQPLRVAVIYDDADGFEDAAALRQSLQIFLENTKTRLLRGGIPFSYDFYHRVRHAVPLRRWVEDGPFPHVPVGSGIFIRAGNRLRELSLASCYALRGGEVRGFVFGPALLDAFRALANPNPPTVAFTVGHGERSLHRWRMEDGLSGLVQWIGRQGWRVETVDGGAIQRLDGANSLLAIVDPRAPFSPAEEVSLQRFLGERRGRLLLILTPDSRAGLVDLLAQWNVHPGDVEELAADSDEGVQIRRFAMDLPFLAPLTNYQLPVQFDAVLPIRGDVAGEGVAVHSLMEFHRPPGAAVSVGVIAQRPGPDVPISLSSGRLAVIGGNFLGNRNFALLGNQLFFQQLANHLLEVDSPPSPPLPEEFRLNLTRTQMWRIGRILIGGPIILLLAACLLRWFRR